MDKDDSRANKRQHRERQHSPKQHGQNTSCTAEAKTVYEPEIAKLVRKSKEYRTTVDLEKYMRN